MGLTPKATTSTLTRAGKKRPQNLPRKTSFILIGMTRNKAQFRPSPAIRSIAHVATASDIKMNNNTKRIQLITASTEDLEE